MTRPLLTLALAAILALLAGAGLSSSAVGQAGLSPDGPDLNGQARGTGILPDFARQGDNLIRLLAGAFDPLADPLPAPGGIALLDEATLPAGSPQYWIVQVRDQRYPDAVAAVEASGASIAGFVHDSAYMVRATPEQRAQIAVSDAVRWTGLYQPAWRIPVAVNGFSGLLDLAGPQIYQVYIFDGEDTAAVVQALAAIPGSRIVHNEGSIVEVVATALQVPAIAAVSGVEWVTVKPEAVLLNSEARWVTDTGVRDVFNATAPGRLTGAGQTAAVADTGVNYKPDLNGNAHIAFRDCDPSGTVCKEALYTQQTPGIDDLLSVVDNNTGHRKMVAFFDLGATGPNPFDESSHGSHTAGSVTGDQGSNGVADGDDGMAPGAHLVHQNIGSSSGGLALPDDYYALFRQAYRPRNPASVATTSPGTGNPVDFGAGCSDPASGTSTCYRPTEDARTHNDSWGLIAQVVDDGGATRVDKFVWDHEDMVIVFSAGNGGPGAGTIISPSLAKNNLSSGASANGRQPMVSIDSMAIFSSHGPSGDDRFGVDLATPGQVIVSVKGGTVDGYHVAQGTSMSAPVLTGLTTLVRQYFFDGYAATGGDGFAAGTPDLSRAHNPSAALVKAALVNGAVRRLGFYTGADGSQRALDGQWPSEGQGFGLVNLDNSLYFANDPVNNWYHDAWRGDSEAFPLSASPATRTYRINVQPGAPFDVTLAWSDPPDLLPAGTPAIVNNLDLIVTAPDGTVYAGNNFNSRTNPSVDVAETIPGNFAADVRNPVERVRIASPQAGVYTIALRAEPIAQGNQGFALAASGLIAPEGGSFIAGPPLQVDAPGFPDISGLSVEPFSADTAKVRFTTDEPTTAEAFLNIDGDATRFVDSYNVGGTGFPGLNEAAVETSADYAGRPVVGRTHEILITGLDPGAPYKISLKVKDLAGNELQQFVDYTSPSNIFQPDAPDIGQLQQGSTPAWRSGTQMYAGHFGGNRLLGAFMFRIPAAAIDPSKITGAAVEMVSAHNWVVPYTDDPLLNVDLLDESVEADWGSQDYDAINDAPADARTSPETTYKRGDYQLYAFSFKCSDIESLKQTLSDVQDGERRAAFRYDASDNVTDGIFSMEFGFNRRSRGPDLRPRLVLFTSGDPYGTACDPSTPATSISNVGIHGGSAPGSVAVTWETDVPSDSMVIYREQGMPDWVQVGTPARTRVHGVDVFALDPTTKYEFAVRSSTCNGATTTDTNNGAGYNFFRPPLPEPPTQDYFFHGNPTDEAEKLSWFFPGVKTTSSLSFSTSPPDNTASLQHTTGVANEDFVTNPLTAWWLGDFSGQLRGDFIFSWYWSNAQQGDSEVSITVFADPDLDLDPTAVQPDRIIGRGTIQLHALSPVPSLQTGRVHVEGVVQSQILIQAAASGLTAEDLTVHYDSLLAPSKVAIPTELAPIPEKLPLTGPVPPPSAGASGLNPPPTRSGPASFVDIQHGTCYCVIPGGKPDLRVSAEEIVFSQQKVKGGQVVAIAATVHNDGSADADNVQVRFDDNGTPIGTPTIVSIPAGGLATVSVNWNTKGIKGTRTITVTADPANAIDESNEANNSAATTVSVKGNKVQNGSFEQSSDGEKPDKWKDEGNTHYKPGGSHGQRRVEAESDGSWTSEPIAVEAGKTYGVSVDVTGASGNLVVEQVTTAGAVVASLTQLLPVSTDGIFQTAETFLTVAPGVTEVRIRLAAPLTGVATFDNVWLWEE